MDQNDNDREAANKRFEEIHKELTKAPAPTGNDVPDWLRPGVPDLYEFFNETAEIWDQKFKHSYAHMHKALAEQLPQTNNKCNILDLGCGTGMEFEYIFQRLPNAHITGIDLAPKTLDQIRIKFKDKMDQITLIAGNYLDIDLGNHQYDYAISTLTVHHLPWENKKIVYKKIYNTLKPNGQYIEGDQTCKPEQEEHRWYHEFVSKLPGGDRGQWNYDVTLSVETNTRLLQGAGFANVWSPWKSSSGRLAIIMAQP